MRNRMTTIALASMVLAGSTISVVSADENKNTDKTKKSLTKVRENKKKIQSEITSTQDKINDVNRKVSDVSGNLQDLINSKINNERKLIEVQNKLGKEMDSLKDQLVNYYMNSFNSNASILESLIKSESTSDFIVKSTHLKYIVDSKDEKVKTVESLLKEQNEVLEKIKTNEMDLVSLQESLLTKQSELEIKKQNNKKELDNLSKEENILEDILDVQAQEEESIKNEINNNTTPEANIPNSSDNVSSEVEQPDESESYEDDEDVETEAPVKPNKPILTKPNDNIQGVNEKGFKSPVSSYRFTSKFGFRTHPVTGERKMHRGVDMAAPKGTTVTSAKGGEVIISKYSNSYGNYVVVNHGDGMSTLYAHLDKRTVSVGDKVSIGERVGLMGSTGMSTGPHLHFEVRINGEHVDPTQWVNIY